MNLSGIISISGKPGLSKIVSQTRTGLIVESLLDGKRFPVHGAERVSSLEDISIYTYEDDVLLVEVFKKMYEAANGEQVISHKSSANELSTYLKEVLLRGGSLCARRQLIWRQEVNRIPYPS